MPAEDTNTRAWQIYGQRQLARAYTPPIPDRLSWTTWDGIGPGAEVLGDVTGRRVLDIGSGATTTPSISPRPTEPASPASSYLRPSTNAPYPPTGTSTAWSSFKLR